MAAPTCAPAIPNDICNILNSIARYENRKPTASAEDLKRAVQLYFTG